MVVKQMQQRRRREDRAGATSGWEERAPPDPRRWRTPAVRTSWRDGCTAAAIAKGSRYKMHGKKSKVDNLPQT
ncbi:hypothetical protein DAI22_10g099501 [Oryza sativa Japonica Group]|nr:hypothetical protein DAI22_10g099501 [Oryza sativa Japonica Group]